MQEILHAIRQHNRIVLLGHVNPDTDCLTSCLVLQHALTEAGKSCHVVLDLQNIPERLGFLLDYMPPAPAEPRHLADCDLIVALDTALKRRMCLPDGFVLPDGKPVCNIDHHLGNERYGDYNWVKADAASTTEMIFLALEALAWPVTAQQATLLYAGLHTDTCGFSLDGVTADTMQVAAHLVRQGADVGWICQKLYRTLSFSEIKLLRTVFDNVTVVDQGRIAYSTVSAGELADTGCKPSDIDEQVSIPRSIAGVKIAFLFSEPAPGKVRINARSEDGINILPLIKSLGGGGHAQAAGAIMTGRVDQVIDAVICAAREFLAQAEHNYTGAQPQNVP